MPETSRKKATRTKTTKKRFSRPMRAITRRTGAARGALSILALLALPALSAASDNSRLPLKVERAEVRKTCQAPVAGVHNGVSGHFWTCDIAIDVTPAPFAGTFELDEDASDITGGSAQFISSSVPCNGLGTDHLTCSLDGATIPQPAHVQVQLFASGPGEDGLVKWKNCASGVARATSNGIQTDKACRETSFKPNTAKPLPEPKELGLKKSCEEPRPGERNGVQGINWRCTVTVTANPSPFAGTFSFIENASAITGGTNAVITGYGASSGWSCSPMPAGQTTCTINGASFSQSGVETLIFDLFAATSDQPVKWKNCVKGQWHAARGEGKRDVEGNCEETSFTPGSPKPPSPSGPAKASIDKKCDPITSGGGNLQMHCTITVQALNNFSGFLVVGDLLSLVAGSPGSLVSMNPPNGDWTCNTVAGQTACRIDGNHFGAGDTAVFDVLVSGPDSGQPTTWRNCGNITALNAAATSGTWLGNSCDSKSFGMPPPAQISVTKTCADPVRNASGTWDVSCAISITGSNLPPGQTIRIEDRMFGSTVQTAQSVLMTGATCSNTTNTTSPTSVSTLCYRNTTGFNAAGGSLDLTATGVFTGSGGKPVGHPPARNCVTVTVFPNGPTAQHCVPLKFALSATRPDWGKPEGTAGPAPNNPGGAGETGNGQPARPRLKVAKSCDPVVFAAGADTAQARCTVKVWAANLPAGTTSLFDTTYRDTPGSSAGALPLPSHGFTSFGGAVNWNCTQLTAYRSRCNASNQELNTAGSDTLLWTATIPRQEALAAQARGRPLWNCVILSNNNHRTCAPLNVSFAKPLENEAAPQAPISAAPRCDKRTTVRKGRACACRFGGARKVSATRCACPRGTRLDARHGKCVKTPRCRKPARLNRKGDACHCPKGWRPDGRNGCRRVVVCRKPARLNRKGTACYCPKGWRPDGRNGCRKAQPRPKCRKPARLNRKGNACICPRGWARASKTTCIRLPQIRIDLGIPGLGGGRPDNPDHPPRP